jgi:hypothetical protein
MDALIEQSRCRISRAKSADGSSDSSVRDALAAGMGKLVPCVQAIGIDLDQLDRNSALFP